MAQNTLPDLLKQNMQINILRKCIEELSKESPRLDYVRGMLETLAEMNPDIRYVFNTGTLESDGAFVGKTTLNGDAAILDGKAKAAMGTMPPIIRE